MIWVDYLLLVVSIIIIVVVLLQQSSDDIKDAFSGETSELFKNRKAQGLELGLKITMIILSIAFVALAIASRLLVR